MDDNATPGLGVGFEIDFHDSFGNLRSLDDLVGETAANLLRRFKDLERASGGAIDMGGPIAQMKAFGNAVSREMQTAAREKARAEKAGEALSRQLEREAEAFGKTRAEIRAAKVETAALAAEQQGLTELAGRLRAQQEAMTAQRNAAAAAADREAQALREAAFAHDIFETKVREGARALREMEAAALAEQRALVAADRAATDSARQAAAAQAAQAAAVSSLRSAVDPLHGAQQRLANDLENAVRLYRSGAIGAEEYERSSRALADRIDDVQRAIARQNTDMDNAIGGARLGANDLTNIAFQVQDIIVSIAAGQNPIMVLMQQGAQLSGIMMQTGATAGQLGKAILGLAIVSTPTAAAIAALAAAETTLAAAQTAATSAGSTAAITSAELAVANEAAAAAALADAAAQRTLATAQAAVAGAARADAAALAALTAAQTAAAATATDLAAAESAVATATSASARAAQMAAAANTQLAAAQTAATGAATAATASATRALAPWLRVLLPVAGVVAAVAGAISLLNDSAKDSAEMEAYARSIGLTEKEIRKLDDVTVTLGDTTKAVFQVAGRAIWEQIGPAVTSAWTVMKDWTSWIFSGVKSAANYLIGGFVGAYNVITKTWRAFPAVIGDMFYSGVNAAIGAINALVQKAVDGLNVLAAEANKILPSAMQIPMLSAPQIDAVNNQYAGAARKFRETVEGEMKTAMGTDWINEIGQPIYEAIDKQRKRNARDRIRAEALEKGYLDPEKGSGAGNARAERLARDAAAIEAQIRNLYALAEAYKVSGAAALIAEARVTAESKAIKQRGDIEAAVNREIRLVIAQRVVDAQKGAAVMRDQAAIQEDINARVAAGNVHAERAADLVKDQIADLPLLAAAQAAQMRGLTDEAMKATAALADQQAERERLRQAEEAARFNSTMASGADRLAELREELRLVGATSAERNIALAILKATQEAERTFIDPAKRQAYVDQQRVIAELTERIADDTRDLNDALSFTADRWDLIASNIQTAAQGIADAFGKGGQAIGDIAASYADFHATRERMDVEHQKRLAELRDNEAATNREIQLYALRSSALQINAYGDMAAAAKGFFSERSKGYKVLETAEKAFRAVQFAMSVRQMAQDIAETVSSVANSAARATAAGAEGVANQSKLPFPLNIAAMAATAAALVAAGIAVLGGGGGGKGNAPATNTGTGTVLGDPAAQSESIKRSIDALREVDTVMLNYSRQMAASLRSIESQIGGVAALLVRNAESINASGGVTEGFKANAIGSILGNIPLVGGILKGLFGTKTTVIGSGLYGGAQSLGDILGGGFDASYYSDIQKKKKFLGMTTSTKYSTQYSSADPLLENQFTLILRSFNQAILAAAGPLGAATSEIQQRLNGFVLNIGKIDLKGLTGAQIEEKLNAVFGAAADNMARAAFPFIDQFQKVGEGAFETLVRVASTIEAVGASLDMLGQGAQQMSIAAKLGLADQFESLSDLTSAVDAYFSAFYTKEEQAAARTAQMGKVFESLGMTMPSTLAGFRQLVEAQDLNTAAGQAAYATLLKLAPAFADLQEAMEGAKSAADIAAERADLERQLLELRGDTAALRALQLAKLDASNRELQKQIWAIQDAQAAAKAADELRKAWQSVGDSLMDEVRRIRGLTDTAAGGGFASLMGQFNAATSAARGGDIDAAKSLPQLSQALLAAAADAATSRQELDRVRAQIAASLEATNGLIGGLAGTPAATNTALLNAAAASQPGTAAVNDNGADSLAARLDALRAEVAQMRADNNAANATIAGGVNKVGRHLDNVTAQSGGDAISTVGAAA